VFTDDITYDQYLGEPDDLPFSRIMLSLMAYGMFLITADISRQSRQIMITIISSTTMCENMVFATSALAENVSMISLRQRNISGVKYGKKCISYQSK
jgi:hypothetical protein